MDANVSTINVKVGGSTALSTDTRESLETRAGNGIVSVSVDLRLDQPDLFSVEYDMMKLERIQLLDTFSPGMEVEISMGLEKQEVLCVGEISYIEPSFDVERGFHTTISGYHKLHRLTRGQRSRTWGEGLDPETLATTPAKEVINSAKSQVGAQSDALSTGNVGSSQLKHKYVPQLNMSDFEFLQALGASLEWKAAAENKGTVGFRQPDPTSTPVLTVSFDRSGQAGSDANKPSGGQGAGGQAQGAQENTVSYLHLDFRLSTVQQYAAVEVRSWDPDRKQRIVAKKTSSTYQFEANTPGHADTGKGLYGVASAGRKYIVVDQPVDSQAEADALAQSLFDQFAMDFLTGELVVEGNPVLVPGKTIAFSGFGKAYSGKYLITAATHSYRPDEGYRTTVAFARNAKAS